MDYLLDSNIFIEAKNRYYGMDICPGFWDWLDRANQSGDVSSVTLVGGELSDGNDPLGDWATDRLSSSWFLDIADEETQVCFGEISNFVMTSEQYPLHAREHFLAKADPWLIAKARVLNSTVVTHEIYSPDIRRAVKIPNVCQQFGVSYMDTFDLLRQHSASFSL